jgi:hypothetical protein
VTPGQPPRGCQQAADWWQLLHRFDDDPIVLKPAFSVLGTLSFMPDPDPTEFPSVVVISATGSTLTDTSFT